MRKLLKLSSLLLFAFSGILIGCSEDSKSKQPNIVLFLADDLGYGDVQCYVPSSKIPTPNIDHLASEGMRFTDAHSPSSLCTPTRYGILTGRYCWRSRLKKSVLGPYSAPLIEKDLLTLPKMLQKQGYYTACIGKWHLGMEWVTREEKPLPKLWDRKFDISLIEHDKPIKGGPLSAGFNYYFGTDVPNFPPYCFIENNRTVGIPSIPKPNNMYGNSGLMLPNWKLEEILPTLADKAVAFIDNIGKEKKDKPFFLYFASTAPHTPIVPAKAFLGKSEAGPYGDLVVQVDDIVGQIEQALERNGLADNTIFILTSDNGSPARAGDPHVHGKDFHPAGAVIEKYGHNPNSPWRGMKADIWEGGHRIPFIVKWPKHIEKGSSSNELISSVDLMATIASITGYQLSNDFAVDSYDVTKVWLSKKAEKDEGKTAVREALVHHSGHGTFSLRQGKWKLITHLGSGGWSKPVTKKAQPHGPKGQLYDMVSDPGEKTNLWNEYPEMVKKLSGLLHKYKEEGRSIYR